MRTGPGRLESSRQPPTHEDDSHERDWTRIALVSAHECALQGFGSDDLDSEDALGVCSYFGGPVDVAKAALPQGVASDGNRRN